MNSNRIISELKEWTSNFKLVMKIRKYIRTLPNMSEWLANLLLLRGQGSVNVIANPGHLTNNNM